MIDIGQAPDLEFEVKFAAEGKVESGLFSSLIDRPTIISVFMRANTGSCDKQMIALAEKQNEIEKTGIRIVGVSRDTVASLNRYAAKHEIGFTLVSDPKFQFAEAVGSMVEKKMYGRTFMGPTRSAYLFDSSGKLVDLIQSIDAANHGEEVLQLMSSL